MRKAEAKCLMTNQESPNCLELDLLKKERAGEKRSSAHNCAHRSRCIGTDEHNYEQTTSSPQPSLFLTSLIQGNSVILGSSLDIWLPPSSFKCFPFLARFLFSSVGNEPWVGQDL